jgi:PAS domain S-box-containing protein
MNSTTDSEYSEATPLDTAQALRRVAALPRPDWAYDRQSPHRRANRAGREPADDRLECPQGPTMSNVAPADRSFALFDVPLGSIIRAAHEAIVMVDERHAIVAVNPAAQRMFGCTAEQALGRSLEQFIPGPHRELHAGRMNAFAASPPIERAMAMRRRVYALRSDGTEFPVEITLSSVEAAEPGGRRRYFAALLRDLSDERALQDEIEQIKQRLRAVFDLAPVAIWIADGDHIVFANLAAARLFGAESDAALLGRSIYELLHAESHVALHQQIAAALRGEPDVTTVQGRLARRDGQSREVEIALAALPDHGRTTVQLVIADVTQRRREAGEVEQSRHLLRRLSASVVEAREEERRRIARELHDELGQRLTALKMELSGLAASKRVDADDPRLAGMLGMLDETVASVRRIAADLRPLMLDDLGLNAAIEWLADSASRRLGIAIHVQLGETEPSLDERVAIAVYRMVQEALTNVARHARATRVEIALAQRGDELLLEVRDDGIGFPERALQREGSFGLVGMRERAQMLGGHLEVDNPPGGGGRVCVRVPLARATDADEH